MNTFSIRRVRAACLAMLICAVYLSFSQAQAACSAQIGKVVFNEVYIPNGGGTTPFIELKILDPSVLASTSNFQNWKIDFYANNFATKQSTDVSSAFSDVSINSCGQTSLWLRFPASVLSFLNTKSPPFNLVLYDSSGAGQIVDIMRLGDNVTSFYGAGTQYASCPIIESQLPATGSANTQYDAQANSGASVKDWFRDPDGTGPWGGQNTSNTNNTVCGSNNGGSGTFGLAKVPSTTSVPVNTNFTYTLYAINGASAVSTPASVVISDTLPAGISFVSCAASPGTTSGTSSGPTGTCTYAAGVVTWTIGAMAANKNYQVTLTVQAASSGNIANTITANVGSPSATATAATVVVTGASIDHVRLNHNGSGVTCVGSTVTVNACNSVDTSGTCVANTSGLSGNVIAKNAGGGTLLSVPFTIAAGSSSTVVTMPVTTAQTVTFSTSGLSLTPTNATTCWNGSSASCSFVYSDAGLLFDVPNHIAEVQQTVTVSAVKKSDNSLACTPAFASVTKNINFVCAYTSPATGTLPVRVGGVALNAANNTTTACDAGGHAVSLAFNASGVASTIFQYADAGNMSLTATYTGAGSDAGLSMSGADIFTTVPDHFDTAVVLAGGVPISCASGLSCPINYNGMVYSGQSFSVQVTAKNSVDNKTPNYTGTFAKQTVLSAWNAAGGSTANPNGSGLSNPFISTFVSGVGYSAAPAYALSSLAAAPTNIYVRACEDANGDQICDVSGVTSLRSVPPSVEGGVMVVNGRIKIPNAYGSELLPLPITALAQYWNGASWTVSATDSVSSFNSKLSSAGGNVVPVIVRSPLTLANISVPGGGMVTLLNGAKTFSLGAPGASGSVNISLNAPAYLGSVVGLITFGVYRGNNNFIYQREAY